MKPILEQVSDLRRRQNQNMALAMTYLKLQLLKL